MQADDQSEWLEADGRGGFASGTSSSLRTRRYHALLLYATTPPTGRMVLVNGFEAWMVGRSGTFALSSQRYVPDVIHPDGVTHIERFGIDPWPTWVYRLPDGSLIQQELLADHQTAAVIVVWTLLRTTDAAVLHVRPLLSGREYHALHHENAAFRFEAQRVGPTVRFGLYDGVPDVFITSNGEYRHAPEWYRQFLYTAERERGLDHVEDLASPGEFRWRLTSQGDRAFWILGSDAKPNTERMADEPLETLVTDVQDRERQRRQRFGTLLERAGDSYIVRRTSGKTVIAGYPWFTDWGRDTFVAVRGLCLATNRLEDARDILMAWADHISGGMVPNRFPDRGESPEFNSVDASLWYVIAVSEFLQRSTNCPELLTFERRRSLERAIGDIVSGYAAGTRFGIRMDHDGLLAAGVDGLQLTWMDACVGPQVITPRIGKPVEVQALWLNALRVAAVLDSTWSSHLERGRRTFVDRFWNERLGRLADVVDVNHVPGTRDDTFRPNQILAIGGLPLALIEGSRARSVVDAVEKHLVTPIGLRSLAPTEPGYVATYRGDAQARDAAYHQGTIWPWLMGPFVEAWVRVRGDSQEARDEARRRFVDPLIARAQSRGGHLSEVADAEAPFSARGCPFQAWSLAELLRLDRVVVANPSE
jgi:predicted glycogen debranching enzyme